MPKFFQYEVAAHAGDKQTFQNVEFKKNNFESSHGAELGTLLEIIPVHIKKPPVIQFIAYIDKIDDKFLVDYTSEQPFGRTDPYHIWKANKREISLSWAIPSPSIAKGLDNLNNLSWFLAALYPSYKNTLTATSISASPLFRVRHANLISSPTRDTQGLLCVIRNVGVTHNAKEGFISVNPLNMGSRHANTAGKLIKAAGFENYVNEGKNFLIPKLITINCSLNVVHDHSLGWDHHTGQWRGGRDARTFPYGFGLVREATGIPSVNPPQVHDAPGSPHATEQGQIANDMSNTPAGMSTGGEGVECTQGGCK